MKLLVCRSCGYIDALKREPRRCRCGVSGGFYNEDGDTVTLWGGDKVFMLGLHNFRVANAVAGQRLTGVDGDSIMWPYPMDNGKVTMLDAAP